MSKPKFPQPYRHDHGPIRNINEVVELHDRRGPVWFDAAIE